MVGKNGEKPSKRWFTGLVASAVCGMAPAAQGQFVEDVEVIRTFTGTGTFGWALADLQDIDGDGVTDLIISAPVANVCRVYSGASGSLIHDLIPSPTGGRFGQAIADAGDVDNDGVHDIIVGANLSGTGGRAFVFSGADGSLMHTFAGEASDDNFGYGVAGAGDVNSDNHADLLVGAPNYDAVFSNAGRAYIFSGIDGTLIRSIDGEDSFDLFGRGTGGTGDIDGDGIGDQIVGAPGAGPTSIGKAYVYSGGDGSLIFSTDADAGASAYGEFFVAGAGDVNNDGTRDVYVADYAANGGRGKAYVYSGVGGTTLYTFGGGNGEGVGPGRAAGDVNGDGYNDLIIGHWTSSTGAFNAGKVRIRSGADGTVLRTITSTTAGENLGFDAIGIGDVNGDNAIDFALSAASQNRVYVIAGERQAPLPTVSEWGLAAMALLLLTAGTLALRSRVLLSMRSATDGI